MFKTISLMSFILVSSMAFAGTEEVRFGQARVTGKGCKAQDVQFVPSPDGQTFSILFTDFILESNKRYDYQLCRILVPVHVPAGKKLEINNMDIRGFMSLPEKSFGGMGVLPRFLNKKGRASSNSNWTMRWSMGEFEDEVLHRKIFKKPLRSHCATKQYLEITAAVAQFASKKQKELRMVAMDSIDAAGSIKGSFKQRPCK